MKHLTKITFITLILICNLFNAQAQNFKWVKGGGAPTTSDQHTDFICTDPNGNVYALSTVGGNAPLIADTFHSSFYYGTNPIILITSYNCNGQMRWAKPIGSSGGACTPFGIAADSLGHIYVTGQLIHNSGAQTLYIGNDTVITGSLFLTTSLLQFDTAGQFNWIRFVGPNTFAGAVALGSLADPLTIDNANNAHYFCYIQQSGIPIMTGVTSIYGVYDITYNTSGNMLSAVRLDLDSEWYLHGTAIDPVTNKLFVFGEVNQSFGAGVDTFFAAAFDASRNLLWWHYPGRGTNDDALSGIALDQNKNLHFCGSSQGGPFSFNGDTVTNTSFGSGDMSIVMMTDSNGIPKWIKHIDGDLSVNSLTGITSLPNGKSAAIGLYAGEIKSGYDSIVGSLGQDPYLVVFNSTGDIEALQHIYGDGFYDWGLSITSDRVGNVYAGGQSVDSIWAGTPPIPAFHSVGGATDFFIMKYGVDCSCTSMPVAAPYTDTGVHTIGFTYTGSTTGLDSVVWNFDDGSMDTGTTALHTYSVAGTYRPCVTIYTDCGSDMYCNNVVVLIPSLITSNGTTYSNLKVWPNPVKDELNITGVVENSNYRLLSITGITIQQGILGQGENTLIIKNFGSGIYILEMTGKDGVRNLVRFVKE